MAEAERTDKELMLAGEFYNSWDPELVEMRNHALTLTGEFNSTWDKEKREKIVRELFGKLGDNPYITPPFNCDYGCYIFAGKNFYANFGLVILDCNIVTIGDDVLFGPNVQIYAATHPTDPELRKSGKEMGYPITIGNNVWLGGQVIVCPGVTIGDDCSIGAGSVVTRNIPPRSVAVGNPCRVVRTIPLPVA